MNFDNFVNGKIYSFFDKICILALLNIIWFLVVIFGLFGILTFFPATIALFILINTSIQEKDFPIMKSFYRIFIKEYWNAQKLFIIYLITGVILYLDIRMYYNAMINSNNFLNDIGFWVSALIGLVYFMTLIQVFMVTIYFPEYKTFKRIKSAFLFSAFYPFRTFLILIIIIGSFLIIFSFPMILPVIFLLLISIITYLTIKIMKPKYDKLLKDKKSVIAHDFIK